MPNDRLTKLMEMAARRRMLIAADEGWKNYDGDQTEKAMAELAKVQSAMVRIDFDDAYAKLIALGVLLDSDDEPNFSDPFKNDLFGALRRSNRYRLDRPADGGAV